MFFAAQPLPIFVAGGWALGLPLPIFVAGGWAFVALPLPVLLAGGWAFVVAPLPIFVLTRPASTQKTALTLQKKMSRRTVGGINFANIKKSCLGFVVDFFVDPGSGKCERKACRAKSQHVKVQPPLPPNSKFGQTVGPCVNISRAPVLT